MNENRWIMNRAGLVNFWYYDDEEFDFIDGRLLLRGSNGSGKSVTMQSFIPLLLDGNKSPERLDPFGSRARKIENYILGDENNEKEESIGYLYMEFKKQEADQYLTIGMGFKAKKGRPMRSWGFSIEDGRRIGKDFFLYKEGIERLPLTMNELENRISKGGHVKESQKNYKKLVNDLLFGFSDLDDYDELIKLLVQLRTPKLSKDFKPTVIYEIMENSLQPLSEDDLRPMSEAIENMDNIKSELEVLDESRKAIDKIKTVFDKYNQFMLYDKANTYLKSKKQYDDKLQEQQDIESIIKNQTKQLTDINEKISQLKIDLTTNDIKKVSLQEHDSVKIFDRISTLETEISDQSGQLSSKKEQLSNKQEKEISYQNRLTTSSDEQNSLKQEIKKILDDMDEIATQFEFQEQAFLKKEILEQINRPYSYTYVKDQLKKYTQALKVAKSWIEQKERKMVEYDDAAKRLHQSKLKKEEMNRHLEQCKTLLLELKDTFIENLMMCHKQNQELTFSQESLVNITRTINHINEENDLFNLNQSLLQEKNTKLSVVNDQITDVKHRISVIEKDLNDKKAEHLKWLNTKDPEPSRDERVLMNRQKLEQEKIPFIPLFKAIDFKDDVSDQKRGEIEETLADMGLLDALIIPKQYENYVLTLDHQGADKYLFGQPNLMIHTVSEWLKPEMIETKGITSELIDNVLRSILIDDDEQHIYMNEQGHYGIGIVKGKISQHVQSKFIGIASRKRHKDAIIKEIEENIMQIQYELDEQQAIQDKFLNKVTVIEEEYRQLPSQADILQAIREVKEANFAAKKSDEEVQASHQIEQGLYRALQVINEEVTKATRLIQIPVNSEDYQYALDDSIDYQECLHKLEMRHGSLIQILEQYTALKEEYDSTLSDIDQLLYEHHHINNKLREKQQTKKDLEAQLVLTDYDQIQKELNECTSLLKVIPEQLNQLNRQSGEIDSCIKNEKHALDDVKEVLVQLQEELEYYKHAFIDEYQLGYVMKLDAQDQIESTIAKQVVKELDIQQQKKDVLISNLHSKFHENSPYLRDYILKTETLFASGLYQQDPSYANRERLNIVGKIRGKEVNLYRVIEFIEESIDENQKLLKDQDRQMFEDILVNNISKKIRAKIFHSEKWVKEMNRLMESMNTSSGLSLSLKWSSLKATNENQLDTNELVELLKQDGHLMKPTDIEKLSEHFRSKLDEARRILKDNSDHQTFHAIIRDILDYRRWFEFKLFYQKTGQSKKELTNNAFFQFSGGEKAMSMYVPLFSAVYARYEGARENCPRLISLDEAFAGVDEKNIRDMFRLLSELELNFIMNSQVLWGDYDTIKSLSISELIRPDNANYVTVIRYKWNGHKKELVI